MGIRLFLFCVLAIILGNPAQAAPPVCNAGSEGTIVYNKDQKLVQFCNGSAWIGMVAQIGGTGDTLGDLTTCGVGEVPEWNGAAWDCGTGGDVAIWTDSGSNYLQYTAAIGARITPITGMAPPDYIPGADTLGALSCSNGQIVKFNGTVWICAADNGGVLPTLNSAQIWVGNASNAATSVAMSGDATISNAGVLTIGSNAIGSAEITDSTIASADIAADTIAAVDIATGGVATAEILDATILLSDLSATGTASATTYLRGDNTWATVPSGADNLGNHTAIANIQLGSNWLSSDGGNEGIQVTPTGLVGIGNITPSLPLDVAGEIRSYVAGSLGGSVYLDGVNASAAIKRRRWIVSNSNGYSGMTGLVFIEYSDPDEDNVFCEGGDICAIRALIETGGNMGLGNTSPKTKLDVTGTVRVGNGAELCNSTDHEGSIRYLAATDAFQMCRSAGTGWEAIGTGSGALPVLASASIWVGNGSNAATAVAMSGDATLSNTGVLTLGTGVVSATEILDSTIASADIAPDTIAAVDIAANAITSSELADAAVTIPKLAATGTASATTFLRGDNTWAVPSGGGGGSSLNAQTFTASGTWTKPANADVVFVECWGGGGSGARSQVTTGAGLASGGGGGGLYAAAWLVASSLPASVAVTVAALTPGTSTSLTNGTAGGNSSFGSYLIAGGGQGGVNGQAIVALGGTSVTLDPSYLAPDIEWGGNGGDAFFSISAGQSYCKPGADSLKSAGGGGGVLSTTFVCLGGSSVYGGSGGAAASTGNATAGAAPGGGGGGRAYNGAGSSGAGARGECRIKTITR